MLSCAIPLYRLCRQMMITSYSGVVMGFVVLAGLLGCTTPNKGVLREAGVMEEEPGSSPDGAPVKVDAPVGDGPVVPRMDTAAAMTDVPLSADNAPAKDTDSPPDTAPPCSNGTTRCAPSGTAVEICMNGQWTTKENCPLTCSGAACTAVCMANVPCTQGIGPCRKGATTCATPSSAPACADNGADDSRGGCSGGNVCKSGACVSPCQAGDGACPAGCSWSQDSDCKTANGQTCTADAQCQSGNCTDTGGRCCPTGQEWIDSACRTPCTSSQNSCDSPGTIRECKSGKLVPRTCLDTERCGGTGVNTACTPVTCNDVCKIATNHQCENKPPGTSCDSQDGTCQSYNPPNCTSYGCGTPTISGTACCENRNCFSNNCIAISGSPTKQCRIKNGDICSSTQQCEPGNVCKDANRPDGNWVCSL